MKTLRLLIAFALVFAIGCDNEKNDAEEVLKDDPIVPTNVRSFGWKKDKNPEKSARLYASIRKIESKDIPPAMDMRAQMSPVENQGPIASCVACSIVGALEFLQIKAGIPKGKRFLDMSKMFVYYNARELGGFQSLDGGCYISHAIASCEKAGVVTEKRWPYTYSRLYKKPNKALYSAARKKLIKDFYYVWGENDSPNPSIENVKAALSEGYPVVFGTSVFGSFYFVGKDGMIPVPNLKTDAYVGGHAMLIVGYTATHFIVRNSWGAEWGDNGYCYIPFEYFNINGSYNPSFDFWVIRAQTNLFTRAPENEE